jgi:tRNA(Ile)-lysidine synthase
VEASAPLVSKVRQALQRLGVTPVGAVVAVSGGPDSVALLRALLDLRVGPLLIAHLNHRLRGAESDRDERFVRELHDSLRARGHTELALACGHIDNLTEAARGHNLEEVARRLRYDWLADQARARGLGVVLTGHTADDQAETVLHRLFRGTGLQGLRGIAHRRPLGPGVEVIRPMLEVTRAEVLAYLAAAGQPYCDDSSNADRRYTRNRIRHELLPLLAAAYNPAVVRVLGRLAEQAEDLYRATEGQAEQLLAEAELPRAGALLVFDRARLAAASRYLVREMFRRVWVREQWPMGPMGFAEWDRLAAVAAGAATAAELPGRIRVCAAGRVLRLGRRD